MAASAYACLPASKLLASHCCSGRGACGFVLVANSSVMFQLTDQGLIQELSILELNMPGKLRTRPKPPSDGRFQWAWKSSRCNSSALADRAGLIPSLRCTRPSITTSPGAYSRMAKSSSSRPLPRESDNQGACSGWVRSGFWRKSLVGDS
jgi:hypothetical protein